MRFVLAVLASACAAGCSSQFDRVVHKLHGEPPAGKAQLTDASGQPLPSFHPLSFGDKPITVGINAGGVSVKAFEIPPMIIGQDGLYDKIYLLPGNATWLCSGPEGITANDGSSIMFEESQCKLISHAAVASQRIQGNRDWFYSNDDTKNTPVPWRKTYDGIFGAQKVGNRMVFMRHGEHTNRADIDPTGKPFKFQSDIVTSVDVNTCFDGYAGGSGGADYQHCWQAFNNFATFGWLPYTGPITSPGKVLTGLAQPEINDEGPILWAPQGYATADGHPAEGVGGAKTGYHATEFVDGGFIYSYFNHSVPGMWSCLASARAPIGANGEVDSHAWKVYQAGGYKAASLPDGFDKGSIKNFYATKGPDYDCLLPDEPRADHHIIYFNVGRLFDDGKFTGYYVGIEERLVFDDAHKDGLWQVGLRISRDLLKWTEFQLLRDPVGGGWGHGTLQYPTLVNRYSTGNHDLDRCQFYALGNQPGNGYQLLLQKVGINIAGLPDCQNLAPGAAGAKPTTGSNRPAMSLDLSYQPWGAASATPVTSGSQLTIDSAKGVTFFYACHDADEVDWTRRFEPSADVVEKGVGASGQWPLDPNTATTVHLWVACNRSNGEKLAGELHALLAPGAPPAAPPGPAPTPASPAPATPAPGPAPAPGAPAPAPAPAPAATPPGVTISYQVWGDPAPTPVTNATQINVDGSKGVTLWYACQNATAADWTRVFDPYPQVVEKSVALSGNWPQNPGTKTTVHLFVACYGGGQTARGEAHLNLQ